MGDHKSARIWRTVTPVALPLNHTVQAETGVERVYKQSELLHAAKQAIRQSGISIPVQIRKIQREPFDSNGTLAERFAFQRFTCNRLYFLELEFAEPINGPLMIGDGRYQGLGLMRAIQQRSSGVMRFQLDLNTRPASKDRIALLEAVRNALMSLARETLGKPGRLFSGHDADGSVARSGKHEHVFLAANDSDKDGLLDELLVIAPWCADRSATNRDKDFYEVVEQLRIIRAGALGVLKVEPAIDHWETDHPLLGLSTHWKSVLPYQPTRFPKSFAEADAVIRQDVLIECQRRHLPKPQVEILKVIQGAKGGVRAHIRLVFAVVVDGPLVLGRDSHQGGGLFQIDRQNSD